MVLEYHWGPRLVALTLKWICGVRADPGQLQMVVAKVAFIPKWSLGSAQTPKPSSVTIFCISILGLRVRNMHFSISLCLYAKDIAID